MIVGGDIVSVLAMYNYNHDLFKNMQVPDGVDKYAAVDSILLECAEIEVLYTNPEFLQDAIGVWSTRHLQGWTRAFRALSAEYTPLENYNKFEDETISGNGTTSGQGETLSAERAFNSGSMIDSDRTSSHTSGQSKSSQTRKNHIHGNIGVTTAAQMIQGDLDVSRFNIYDMIVRDFKTNLCLEVY